MSDVKSEQELIDEVSKADSKVLAAHVVIYRSLGMNKDLAKACMTELATRRKNGDDFEYEDFIDEKVAGMPKMKNTNFLKITQNIQSHVRTINGGGAIKTDHSKNSG